MAIVLRLRKNIAQSKIKFLPVVFLAALGLVLVSKRSEAPVGSTGGVTEVVSVSTTAVLGDHHSSTPSISADGRFVAFESMATNLVAGDTTPRRHIYVHDRQTGATERVSVSSAGQDGNHHSSNPSISADGRFVAFESQATDLVAGNKTPHRHIYVRDRQAGTTERVSVSTTGELGNNHSSTPSISADGRFVAFESQATNLAAGSGQPRRHIFVRDRQTGVTEQVSVSSVGQEGNKHSFNPSISSDGRFVAYESQATNLAAGSGLPRRHIFVRDRQTGATERVSVSSVGQEGNSHSFNPSISADGRLVAFESLASNLVEGDANTFRDIFVHDRKTGLTERASVSSGGQEGNQDSINPSISGAGRYVAFESLATNLVDEDTNLTRDIFVHDRETGETTRVSVSSSGDQGNSPSSNPSINEDGHFVAFESLASNLIETDANGHSDVFVHFLNRAPLAVNDAATTVMNDAVTVSVLANDSDPDGDPLVVASVTQGANGSAIINSNGTITYTPKPSFIGADTFTYTISDSFGASASATVSVVVNPPPNLPPIALDDAATTPQNTPVTINVLANDSDPDGDPLTVVGVTQPGDGAVAINANNTVTYTPNAAFVGINTFTYTISDGRGGTATANVSVTVTPGQPTITGFTPTSGKVGTTVTITGTNFTNVSAVKFNGLDAPGFTIISPTSITVAVPLGASSGPVSVTTPLGTATSTGYFIVLATEDFALSVSPGVGTAVPGTSVSYSVQITSTGSTLFTGLASLTTGPLPAGVSATFTPSNLTSNASGVLTLTTASVTSAGTHVLEVRATAQIEGRAVQRTASVTLGVQEPGQTILVGEVRDENERPLPGVSIKLGGSTLTDLGFADAGGNFFIPLTVSGNQVFLIDGSALNNSEVTYSTIPVTLNISQGAVNYIGFIPKLHAQPVAKLTPIIPGQSTVVTVSDIPGFSVSIPAGAQIIGWDGQPNTQMGVTTIPIGRSPLPPLPADKTARQIYLFSFGKMGGGLPTGNIVIDTPNDVGGLPGDKIDLYFFNEAPDGTAPNQWEKYGTGTVSSDGTRIITDINPVTGKPYGIPRFCCGARFNAPPAGQGPAGGPSGGPSGGGSPGGEPVDTATGFFYLDKTDMVLPGILPITITRTYRTNLTGQGPFGIGTSWPYDIFLRPPPNGSPDSLILITPGNRQDIFSRQPDGSFMNTTAPPLRGAVVTVAPGGLSLRYKDGTVWRFDINGRLIRQTDRNGNSRNITRDATQGRVTGIADPAGRNFTISYTGTNLRIDRIRDPIGREVRYSYDASGRLAQVTDPASGVTSYTYDSSHRMTSITDPRGITFLRNEYDSAGRVIRQTQPDGGVWTFAYTTSGNFISESKVADPRGNTTTYRFKADGYLISQIDALGQSTTYDREPGTNLVVAAKDPLGRVTKATYDANGNVTRATDPVGNRTTFVYDPKFNQPVSTSDPLRNTTAFEYDALGNLTVRIDPLGNKFASTYNSWGQQSTSTDPLGNTSVFSYDADGNLVLITDPLGNTTRRGYDKVSRLISETDPVGHTTRFAYDLLDRLVQITNPLGGITEMTYDSNDNLLSIKTPTGSVRVQTYDVMGRLATKTDPLGRGESYEYDLNGNLIRFTDRRGQTTAFTYDSLNRQVGLDYADGSRLTFHYDLTGNLTGVVDTVGGTIINSYDVFGRLITQSSDTGSIMYEYDSLGRRTSMLVAGQRPVTYRYDSDSRLAEVTRGTQIINLQYDALGRRTRLLFPNSVSTEYNYDAASGLTAIAYQNTFGPIGDLKYQFDPSGNRTSVSGSLSRVLLPQPISSANYDVANQQQAFAQEQMTYDQNGNLLTLGSGFATTTFTWDVRDRLVGINGPTLKVTFEYDGYGRRTRKTINGQTFEFLYDGEDIVQEGSVNGVVNYVRNLGIDEPFVRGEGEYFLQDAVGNVVAITDVAGAIKTRYAYEPFGNTSAEGTSQNSFQFSGRENDGIGLYFYRARYYDPVLSRFVSEDPLEIQFGSNLYAYVDNSPTNFSDPSGQSYLIFTRNVGRSYRGLSYGTLALYDKDNKLVTTCIATNYADSRSNGRWPNGRFPFAGWRHLPPGVGDPGFGYDNTYGASGAAEFFVAGRPGMQVHAGRARNPRRRGAFHWTKGCIRTEEGCMRTIRRQHFEKEDPLTYILVR